MCLSTLCSFKLVSISTEPPISLGTSFPFFYFWPDTHKAVNLQTGKNTPFDPRLTCRIRILFTWFSRVSRTGEPFLDNGKVFAGLHINTAVHSTTHWSLKIYTGLCKFHMLVNGVSAQGGRGKLAKILELKSMKPDVMRHSHSDRFILQKLFKLSLTSWTIFVTLEDRGTCVLLTELMYITWTYATAAEKQLKT